jgi:hypothetical protein
MIGRAKIVSSFVTYPLRWRFITLGEAGDIGKTEAASAIAEALCAARCRRYEESLQC